MWADERGCYEIRRYVPAEIISRDTGIWNDVERNMSETETLDHVEVDP